MILPSPKTWSAALLCLVAAVPAYPWGKQGHEALALAATQNLTADARAHVVKILGSDDLSSIAVWMDELRSAAFHTGPLADDRDAHRFNAAFPENNLWHYVDLPLGEKAYSLDDPYSNPTDVVHMAEEAVNVLEGGGDKRITKLDALKMLVHFVGDMHQPLHVGNGYYAEANGTVTLVTDPDGAKDLHNDKGGNALFFGPGRFDELHAYWDTELVEKVAHTKEPVALAVLLEKAIAADGASWKSAGDYHHWPEAWASESLATARTAYAGIEFGAATDDAKGGFKKILIKLPAGYDDTRIPLAQERLAKAGYHLAEILNAIHWSD